MTATSITFEENGFPTELCDDRDIARAVAAQRLVADTIVRIHGHDGSGAASRARDVPRLRPFLGIVDTGPDVPSPRAAEASAKVTDRPVQLPERTSFSLLKRGQNIAVPPQIAENASLHIRIASTSSPESAPEVDFSAFILRGNDRIGKDCDMVFYNNDSGDGGAVRQYPPLPETPSITIFSFDLKDVTRDVSRICVAASIDTTTSPDTFQQIRRTRVELIDPADDTVIARYDHEEVGRETALVLGELYRRGTIWKFRAVGQGYFGGLGALAQSFGVDIA